MTAEISGPQFDSIKTITTKRPEAKINDQKIVFLEELGHGGSKRVFRVMVNENVHALAVPNTSVDSLTVVNEKWQKSIAEAAIIPKIREIGMLTHPQFDFVVISINNQELPAILMTCYDQLPFKIIDGKSFSKESDPSTDTPLHVSTIMKSMEAIVDDIVKMINSNLMIDISDSINIAFVDGIPRIFLSDLGDAFLDASFDELPQNFIKKHIRMCVNKVLTIIRYGFLENNHDKYEEILTSNLFDFETPGNLQEQLIEEILGRLK